MILIHHDEGLVIRRLDDGAVLSRHPFGPSGVGGVAVDDAGTQVAYVDRANTLHRLDVSSGEDVAWAHTPDQPSALGWLGSERLAVVYGNGQARVWSAEGVLLAEWKAHPARASVLAVESPTLFWTVGRDNRLRRWDIDTLGVPARVLRDARIERLGIGVE